MKAFLLTIALLLVIGQAQAQETQVKDLSAYEAQVEEVLKTATQEENQQYKTCVMEDVDNCVQDIFGDINN